MISRTKQRQLLLLSALATVSVLISQPAQAYPGQEFVQRIFPQNIFNFGRNGRDYLESQGVITQPEGDVVTATPATEADLYWRGGDGLCYYHQDDGNGGFNKVPADQAPCIARESR